MTKTMSAITVKEHGAPLELRSVQTPEPGPGQILVRVESASVNFSDVKRVRGDAYPFPTEFPFTPGGEIVGTVELLGPGVEAPAIGQRVLILAGTNGFGGYAQYALCYAAFAMPLPPGIDSDLASTALVAGVTAKLLLDEAAKLESGESVFIPAASGGVGTFLKQLARAKGATTIIAGFRGSHKRALALEFGATAVVDYGTPGWWSQVLELTDGRGVNVALEASGGSKLSETFRCTAPFGRIIVFGASSGKSAELSASDVDHLLYSPAPNISLSGFNVGGWFMEKPQNAGQALFELIGQLSDGSLEGPPISRHPLSEADQVHRLLASGESSGKFVLKPWM